MPEDFSAWWALGSALTLPLVRLPFRVHVEGIERVPSSGAAILAFNHVSVLDGPVLVVETALRRRRTVRFLVAAEVFGHRFYGPVLRRFDQIPIRRGEGDTEAVEEAIETVRAGALAAISPEGLVNPEPEAGMQRIRSGCARIAIATGAPVIPVGIWGTQRRWPQGGLTLRRAWHRHRLAIVFGPPILPHPADDVTAFGARVGGAIAEQVGRARSAS
ncbi:MAG: lysophospholipid acyltransferase family protein [Actinomycetota bacterium]